MEFDISAAEMCQNQLILSFLFAFASELGVKFFYCGTMKVN